MGASRKLLFAALAFGLAGVVVYALLPKPVPVDLVSVVRGPIRVMVEEDGKTRVKERYTVSAPLGGRLLRIALDPGDAVEEGKTLIAALEPAVPDFLDVRAESRLKARLSAADAAREQAVHVLERARVEQKYALASLDRLQQAHGQRAVSRQDLDDAEARERSAFRQVESARFGLRVAEFELEHARAALLFLTSQRPEGQGEARFNVSSPISGHVLRVFQESEAVVSPGTPLVELGDSTRLEVEVDVLSMDAVRIRPGAEVIMERWGGDEPLHGRVRLVEPGGFTKISALGVEEQRVNVIVDLVGPPEKWRRLGDGYRVDASIVVSESQDVLKVPAGALFRHDGRWSVYVYRDGRAGLRSVKIGQRNDLEAEVLEGLDENTRVIAYPSDRVKDNVSIVPRSS